METIAQLAVLMTGEDVPDLADLLARPAWMADAACREHPGVNYFPTQGEDVRPAKAVCATCLVRSECLAFALEDRRMSGIWGGRSEKERRRLRRSTAVESEAA